MADFRTGDRVTWNTPQGKTTGTVVKKLTEATEVSGHHVAASKEAPQYLVESEKSGKRAAHKSKVLTKAGA